MAQRKKQNIIIPIKVKKPWEVSRGHQGHIAGSGTHDNRPKRMRTRNARKRAAIQEY